MSDSYQCRHSHIKHTHSHHTADATKGAAIWLLWAVGHDGQVLPRDRVELRPDFADLHVHEGEGGSTLPHLCLLEARIIQNTSLSSCELEVANDPVFNGASNPHSSCMH